MTKQDLTGTEFNSLVGLARLSKQHAGRIEEAVAIEGLRSPDAKEIGRYFVRLKQGKHASISGKLHRTADAIRKVAGSDEI